MMQGEGKNRMEDQAKLEKYRTHGNRTEIYGRVFMKYVQNFSIYLPPTIEPTATGHIVEQIEMTQAID
jgi:cysteinyl-tRNA synthetase